MGHFCLFQPSTDKHPEVPVSVRPGQVLGNTCDNLGILIFGGVMAESEKRVQVSLGDSEEDVVMGLKTIKAIGDCLLCTKAEDLEGSTIPTIGNLLIDQADRVWGGLEGVVI